MTKITLQDEKTGVTVCKKGGDSFSVHLGNQDFELDMSKEELEAMKNLIDKVLSGEI